jgi:hypothetical protein
MWKNLGDRDMILTFMLPFDIWLKNHHGPLVSPIFFERSSCSTF